MRRYRSLSKQLRGWLATGLVPGHSVAPPALTFDLTILKFTHASGYFVVLIKCWIEIFGANAVAFVAYYRYKLPFLERQVSVM